MALVGFYEALQTQAKHVLNAITPFDAVVPAFGFEGLCVCGMGPRKYEDMAVCLFKFLPHLLPMETQQEVASVVRTVRDRSQNGFDLLFSVMRLGVPGINETLIATVPTYHRGDDIFAHVQTHTLFFLLGGQTQQA